MARDTGPDWALIGETEPWYGVLSASKFLKANLTETAVEEFYEQGRSEIAETVEVLGSAFGFSRAAMAVDFGCGVGRQTFAMRDHADAVYGIDISSGMLKEAMKQAALRRVRGVTFASVLPDGQAADWINSYIVFQNINPREGYWMMGELLSRLKIGGHLSLHLTFCHDDRHTAELVRNVKSYMFDGVSTRVLEEQAPAAEAVPMFDYDLNRVMRIMHRAGVRDVLTRHTDHGGCHGVWLFGKSAG